MIKFQSFLSGSSGNCTYVTNDDTHILVDCGASGKYITACLRRLGLSADKIDAILVTHEHRDHVCGVGIMARKYNIPVIATLGTHQGMKSITGDFGERLAQYISAGEEIKIGTLSIRPFSIPHDANEPVGYRIFEEGSSLCIATDIGHISDELADELSGCDSIIIEANHDPEMLRTGRYPYHLKRRIAGERGHLANDTSARLCLMLAEKGTKSFWLGHLSRENNTPSLALETVKSVFKKAGINVGADIGLGVLPQYWLKEEI